MSFGISSQSAGEAAGWNEMIWVKSCVRLYSRGYGGKTVGCRWQEGLGAGGGTHPWTSKPARRLLGWAVRLGEAGGGDRVGEMGVASRAQHRSFCLLCRCRVTSTSKRWERLSFSGRGFRLYCSEEIIRETGKSLPVWGLTQPFARTSTWIMMITFVSKVCRVMLDLIQIHTRVLKYWFSGSSHPQFSIIYEIPFKGHHCIIYFKSK